MFTHYVDFSYSENGAVMAGGSPALAQHAIAAVHSFNILMAKKAMGGGRSEEDIAYPQMRNRDDDRRRRLGHDVFLVISLPTFLPKRNGEASWRPGDRLKIVRVFGSEIHLSLFLQQEDVVRMISFDLVKPLSIRPVPEDHGRCIFRRERSGEKQTLSYILQSEKRYSRRDSQRLQTDPNSSPRDSHEILIKRLEKLERAVKPRSPCFISMSSKSNGSSFSLSIERTTAVSEGEIFFNSYGLASSPASWVPDF